MVLQRKVLFSFAEFHQNTGGSFGVQKSDLGAPGPNPGLLVDEFDPFFLQPKGKGQPPDRHAANIRRLLALYAEADVTAGVGIEAHGGSGGMAGKFYGNVALFSPDDEHLILILGEGLDYAEGFHASEPRRAEPGAVMKPLCWVCERM